MSLYMLPTGQSYFFNGRESVPRNIVNLECLEQDLFCVLGRHFKIDVTKEKKSKSYL